MFTSARSFSVMYKRILLVGAIAFLLLAPQRAMAADPCCQITAIDARTNMVMARQLTTGQTFVFASPNAATTASLKVGQKIFVNFGAGAVSLDGARACCRIVNNSSANPLGAPGKPAAPATQPNAPGTSPGSARPSVQTPAKPTPASTPAASTPGSSGIQSPATSSGRGGAPAPLAAAAAAQSVEVDRLPQFSLGEAQPVPSSGPRDAATPMLASGVNKNVVHLRGIEGIEQAAIPQGAKDLLIMHAMTLAPEEVDHYVVNTKLAEEWIKTHPVPPAPKKGNTHSGCHAISMHCASEAGKHAEGEAARQSEKLREEATHEWKKLAKSLATEWRRAEGCFEEKTLHGDIPVPFSAANTLPLNLSVTRLQGRLSFGVPISGKMTAHLDVFYIPCLPFAVRPKGLGADGTLQVGAIFGAGFTAQEKVGEKFKIPPSGPPQIPIKWIPVNLDGIPMAGLQVNLHVDGLLEVDAEGKVQADFKLDAEHQVDLDFYCDGKGCKFKSYNVPRASTVSEAAKMEGRVHLKPSIYAGVELDFAYGALKVRAGTEPYIVGEVYGCTAASATQSTMAATQVQQSNALFADVDWGIGLRAEASVGVNKIAKATVALIPGPLGQGTKVEHLYFADLIHSTALIPMLEASSQPTAGKTVAYRMKMPSCYPYGDAVEYQVKTGGAVASNASGSGATASAGSPLASAVSMRSKAGSTAAGAGATGPCSWQKGDGDCWGDPQKGLVFGLEWPAAGNYALSATPVHDKHGRNFSSGGKQVNVTVGP